MGNAGPMGTGGGCVCARGGCVCVCTIRRAGVQTELCARGARGCGAQRPPWVPPPCTSWDPHLELGVPPGWDQVWGAPTGPQPSRGDGDGDGLCFIPGARGLQGGGRRPPPPDAAAPGGNAGVIAPLAAALARPRPLAPNFLA